MFLLLHEGIKFNKLEKNGPFSLRLQLESGKCKLPRKHVADCIPRCREMEIEKWKAEIPEETKISITFDGTCHTAEMINLIFRFISKDKIDCHRLVELKMLSQSFTGNQLSAWLVDLTSVQFRISLPRIVAMMRDGASVNTFAAEVLSQFNNEMLSIICLSHGVNVAGNLIKQSINVATTFIRRWGQLIARSPKARMKFKQLSNKSALQLGKVRWFCFCELGIQIYEESVLDMNMQLRILFSNIIYDSQDTFPLFINSNTQFTKTKTILSYTIPEKMCSW